MARKEQYTIEQIEIMSKELIAILKKERKNNNIIGGQPLQHQKEYEENKQLESKRVSIAEKLLKADVDLGELEEKSW